ncbi:MAG: EF-hand domain-containing protein [Pseudomonadota bacterium]
MDNLLKISVLGLAILLGDALQNDVQAQEGQAGKAKGFSELDKDGNGQLTKAEIESHMQARFNNADTDSNGALSRDELVARGKKKSEERANRMLERLDANEDGALTFAEMKEGRGGKLFNRADANGDGAISEAEFEEMKQKRRAKRAEKSE